jgi:hypothetical protein
MKRLSEEHGSRRYRLPLAAIALIIVIAASWGLATLRAGTLEYVAFTRPDGHYRLVVVRKTVWPALMPGQAGDAPGMIRLYDRHGKLLHETKVEMVQLVDHVEWVGKKVRIKLIAEWDLPD